MFVTSRHPVTRCLLVGISHEKRCRLVASLTKGAIHQGMDWEQFNDSKLPRASVGPSKAVGLYN